MKHIAVALVLGLCAHSAHGQGQGGGGGGGGGGNPNQNPPSPSPPDPNEPSPAPGPTSPSPSPGGGRPTGGDGADTSNDYNLEVELFIFGEETQVQYGGVCSDACAGVDLGDTADSSSSCAAAGDCQYTPFVPYSPFVAASCSDAAVSVEADCIDTCTGDAEPVAATCGTGVDGDGVACAVALPSCSDPAISSEADCVNTCTGDADAVAATCGTGFDADNVACALNADGNGCAVETGDCSFVAGYTPVCDLDAGTDASAECPTGCTSATRTWSNGGDSCAVQSGDCAFQAGYTPVCDLDAGTDSSAECPAGCTPASRTWSPEEPEILEVAEDCTQTSPVDCAAQPVDCPDGLCIADGCTGAGACVFTPDNIPVPANSVKYNVRSSQWPFCGDANFLSVVVEMTQGEGQVDDGSQCTRTAECLDPEDCTSDEEALAEACAAATSGGESACVAVNGCTFAAGAAVTSTTCTGADLGDSAPSPELCDAACSYSPPACAGDADAVAATCGTGFDADNVACALNADGNGCAVETGDCVFVAGYTPVCDLDADTDASAECPTGCTMSAESCNDASADEEVSSAASALTVRFKGRSPNVDICSTGASAGCMNVKFGKIEERGPDAVRKVNAHSIMSLASRNNLPTWESGQTTYGSSSAVTYVKMSLTRTFRRGCSTNGRDGGAALANAARRPPRAREAVQLGSMVAEMPTQAMIAPRGSVDAAQAPGNITVSTTDKGVEFIFPAFSSMYYDPVVASAESFESCVSCQTPGCTDDSATNYNPEATLDDGSCTFPVSPSPPPTPSPPGGDNTPTPSPPASESTPSPPPPPTAGSVVATLTLSGDLETVAGAAGSTERTTFEANFKADVAAALNPPVSSDRVRIVSIAAGSVVVVFEVLPSADGVSVSASAITAAFSGTVALPTVGVSTEGAVQVAEDTTPPPPPPPSPPSTDNEKMDSAPSVAPQSASHAVGSRQFLGAAVATLSALLLAVV